MVRHNNIISYGHFHKDWQKHVKTWFNQPAQKKRRNRIRQKKAVTIAPRPLYGPLRPVVQCPTIRYNIKSKLGRGFTVDELKAAGLNRGFASSIGIAVDKRRVNKSVEAKQINVQRLKEYMSKVIIFPRNKEKLQKFESPVDDYWNCPRYKGDIMPIRKEPAKMKSRVITEEDKNFQACHTLRKLRRASKKKSKKAKKAEFEQEA